MDLKRILEKDVPECYFSMAVTQTAMTYYMFYEAWAGAPGEDDFRSSTVDELPEGRRITDDITEIVDIIFRDAVEDAEGLKERITDLREFIKQAATSAATYTDRFGLYEYIFNRIKPVDRDQLKSINNDAAARDILSAIFASGDNAEINMNIKLALSQLPLRMTKSRFSDILDDTLGKYKDTDAQAFRRELYMIRSSAGIYPFEGGKCARLEELTKELEGLDFSSISAEQFSDAEQAMETAATLMKDMSEFYQMTEQIVNYLLMLIILYPIVSENERATMSEVRCMIDEASKGLKENTAREMTPEL